MIKTLYECFQPWSKNGSVYIISDPHLGDSDCKLMSPNWPDPEEYVARLAEKIHMSDTLICLGDVGNVSYLNAGWKPYYKRPHTVLIAGNHDDSLSQYKSFFDEIYTGPLIIAEKIILSHEPIEGINWALNIHGHAHNSFLTDKFHMNLAANVIGFEPVSLGDIINSGTLKKIRSLHRATIDAATAKKQTVLKSWAIVSPDIELARAYYHAVVDPLIHTERVKCVDTKHYFEFVYDNGIIVRYVNGDSSARGHRFDKVFIDVDTPKEVIRCRIMSRFFGDEKEDVRWIY